MYYVNLLALVAVLVLLIVFRKYDRKRLKALYQTRGIYRALYPPACKIYNRCFRRQALRSREVLKKLHPVENIERLLEERYLKNISLGIIVFIFANAAAAGIQLIEKSNPQIIEGKYIERNSYGEGSRQVDLTAILEDSKEKVTINIGEKQYSKEALADLQERCNSYIQLNVLGLNPDFTNISEPLNFFNEIPGETVSIQWLVSDYSLIGLNGTIKNETLKAPEMLVVTAQCSYFDFSWEYSMNVTVVPGNKDSVKLLDEQLQDAVSVQESKTIEQDYMELPQDVNGIPVSWQENTPTKAGWVLLLGGVMISGLFIHEGESRKKQEKVRSLQLATEYPVFVHKMVLLLGAGMTAKAAWFKMVSDYEKGLAGNVQRKYVYEEMIVAALEMQKGITEIEAYEGFGRRCGQNQYLKFSSILIQSVRTGAKGLGNMLSDAADEAIFMRRESAKRLGEEAGTKLLFPMVVLLSVVMLILIIPAFMTMNF